MSNSTSKKTQTIMLRGVAAYPKLNAPYSYDQQQKKSVIDRENGQFSVDVILDADAANKVKSVIQQLAKDVGVRDMRNPPWADEEDKATGEPTGRTRFRCKAYGKRRDGSPNKVPHFSASARPMPSDTMVTSGSEIRVEVYPRAFKELGGGCRLNINAVQVLTLVEASGPNPFTADPDFVDTTAPSSAFEAEGDTTSEPSLDF